MKLNLIIPKEFLNVDNTSILKHLSDNQFELDLSNYVKANQDINIELILNILKIDHKNKIFFILVNGNLVFNNINLNDKDIVELIPAVDGG